MTFTLLKTLLLNLSKIDSLKGFFSWYFRGWTCLFKCSSILISILFNPIFGGKNVESGSLKFWLDCLILSPIINKQVVFWKLGLFFECKSPSAILTCLKKDKSGCENISSCVTNLMSKLKIKMWAERDLNWNYYFFGNLW